ncbi:hypothetical protein [Deinococcus malanensis]|uniref:hypothetical protein n=1 Tax=Deinococcus malanensis TaxID=1706855 RepID=UPI001E391983|nr:hypothetical protein [Deinococcus malanensis]
MTRSVVLLALVLTPVLSGCQDQEARAQNEALTRRVAALEAQVRILRDREQAPPASAQDARTVTLRAAAQNCANDLTRTLETYREGSIDRRYPAAPELVLPDACMEQRVNWVALEAQTYTFTITGDEGQELARATAP